MNNYVCKRCYCLMLFAVLCIAFSPSILAGSFTSYPTSTDTDGTYSLSWGLGGSGAVSSFSVQEYKNGHFTSAVAESGSSVTLSGRGSGSYRYDLQVTRRVFRDGEWFISSSVEHSITVQVSVQLDPPDKPTMPVISSTGNYTVEWNTVPGANSYTLQERVNNNSWNTVQDSAANNRTYSGKSVGTYSYQVKSCNAATCSAYSEAASMQVIYPPASPPTFTSNSLETSFLTTGSFILRWSPVSTATSYILQHHVDGAWRTREDSSAINKSFEDLPLGAHSFRVKACNAGGCSASWSPTFIVTLSQIPNISGANPSREAFTLSVAGRGVYINVIENGTRIITEQNDRSFTLSRTPGQYTYRAQTCIFIDPDIFNCTGYGMPFSLMVIGDPGIPGSITPSVSQSTTGTFDVGWGAANGVIHQYQLYQQFNGGSWELKYSGTDTGVTIQGLHDGDYKYQIRGCNTASSIQRCSNYQTSAIVTVSHPPSTPAKPIVPSNSYDGNYTVSWSQPAGNATYFHLLESQNGEPYTTIVNNTPSTAAAFSEKASSSYTYIVKACNRYDWACSASSPVAGPVLVNRRPVASVSEGKTVDEGSHVTLSGTGSDSDGSISSYQWSQVEGSPTVSISQSDSASASFTAPSVSNYTTLTFRLTVTDNHGATDSDDVNIRIRNKIPIVEVDDAVLTLPDVPAQQNVGELNGQGGVSGGAATYRIPISVPPGRADMTPEISLHYTSRGSNGIAGVGWNLTAVSSIHRCSATVAQDGFTASVQYHETRDRLCLDGRRLISTEGVYGQNGTIYRTELDSFVRVTQTGGAINGSGTQFLVETKDNRVNSYGLTSQAKQQAGGRTEILSWAISESKDRSGNVMTYHYNHHGEGEYTLKRINYTGIDGQVGSDGRNGSGGNRHVSFEYENRKDSSGGSDYRTWYSAGGKTRQTKRLRTINTFYDNVLVRSYSLIYNAMSLSSGRTLLRGVQECAYKNTIRYCLPITDFEWQEAVPNYVLEPVAFDDNGSMIPANNADKITEIIPKGDINGDGVIDWPGVDTNNDDVIDQPGFLADAEQTLKGRHSEFLGGCDNRGQAFVFGKRCLTADINQDGKTDYFKVVNLGGRTLQIKYTGQNNWINTGVALEYFTDEILSFSDINADGWPDLSVLKGDSALAPPKAYVYLNSKNPSAPFSASNRIEIFALSNEGQVVLFSYSEDIQEIGDMDGNGTPDFIVYLNPRPTDPQPGMPYPYKLLLTHSQTNGGITLTEYRFTGYLRPQTSINLGDSHFFHDINGDGLADWLSMNTDGSGYWLETKLNQGGSFSSQWINLNINIPTRALFYNHDVGEPEVYIFPVIEKTLSMDYNADGKAELLFASNEVVASACSLVFHFLGTTRVEDYLCDESLWGVVRKTSNSNNRSPVNGNRKDISARKYKAIYFDEQSNGGIIARIEDTDIVAATVERAALDATGNGLTDVVTTFTCKIEGCAFNDDAVQHGGTQQDSSLQANTVYINRNVGAALSEDGYEAVDVIKKISTGLGVENSWVYRPLGTGSYSIGNTSFYNADHDYLSGDIASNDPSYFHFGSSMMVVAEHTRSNGLANAVNATQYRYSGATFNNKGRGFQGFRTITMDDPNGIRSVTDFHQMFPQEGNVESVRTCLVSDDDEDCSVSPLSQTQVSYHNLTTANDDVYWVLPTRSTKQVFALNNRLTRLSQSTTTVDPLDTDEYGNISTSVTSLDNGFSVVTVTTENFYSAVESNWWINRLDTTVTTSTTVSGSAVHESVLDPTKKINTEYTWTSARLPDVVTTTPLLGDDQASGKVSILDMDYNVFGLPIRITRYEPGQNTRRKLMSYSSNGEVASEDGYFVYSLTNEAGHITTTKTYPMVGQTKQIIDANGLVTRIDYDAFARMEQLTPPTGSGQPQFERFAQCNGGCNGVVDENIVYKMTTYQAGAPLSILYKDKLNRVVLTKTQGFDGSDIFVRTQYDELGRKIFESVPSNSALETIGTRYANYDVLGRLTEKIVDQPDNQSLTISYNHNGHTTQINANGLTMSRTYSGNSQLIRTEDALGGVTQYAYDSMGNPIVLQDANSHSIKAAYNALGQKLFVDDPNMGRKIFTYTSFGEVDTEIDANANIIDYSYDSLGRITNRNVNGATEASFIYDATGCKGYPDSEIRSNLPAGESYQRIYDYDSLCRPAYLVTNIDGTEYAVVTQYDSGYGREKAMTYPTELTVAKRYNERGYLTHSQHAESGYVYQQVTQMNARGQLTAMEKADGVLNEIQNYAHETGQMTSIYVNSVLGTGQRHRIDYSYDDFGNLQQQNVESMRSSTVVSSTENYIYDDLHRLQQTTRDVGGAVLDSIDYDYDAVGNIKIKSDYAIADSYVYGDVARSSGNAGPNAVRSLTKVKDGSVVNFGYDGNGNLLSGDGKTLSYNAFNKPTSIRKNGVTSTLHYGANQQRYKQVKTGSPNGVKTTLYIDKVYERITFNGITQQKVYFDDVVITDSQGGSNAGSNVHFLHRDRLGSVVTVTDEDGNVVDNKSFDPFGKPRKGTLELVDPTNPATLKDVAFADVFELVTQRGFTNHEHLDESELIHMNGRLYDYNLGRFLSVDPFIFDPGNSQSLNPYSYIMNNPLAGTDPSGYYQVIKCGGRLDCEKKRKTAEEESSGGNQNGSRNRSKGNGANVGQSAKTQYTTEQSQINSQQKLAEENKGNIGGSNVNSGNITDVLRGILIGIIDENAKATYNDPFISIANPLMPVIPGVDPSLADILGIPVYISPFSGAANAKEQLGRNLTPAVMMAIALIGHNPGSVARSAAKAFSKATKGGVKFGQGSVKNAFAHGPFKGRTIGDVADGLRSGKISPDSLPVEFIVRNGERVALNNRSMTALRRAGMEPTKLINRTGSKTHERLLDSHLRGGQPSDVIRIRGVGPRASSIE